MSHSAPCLSDALRLLLFALLAVAVLLGTSLLAAGALSLVYGGAAATPANLTIGVVCALIIWLFVAVFHLRKETLTLPVPERERFLDDVRVILTEMGYEVTSRNPSQLSTRPRFHALLLGGGIQVDLRRAQAHVTGPKVCIELLRSRLRIQSHLGGVRQALRVSHRFGEPLIQRAELRLRLKPEQLDEVRVNVIEVLQATAAVVCEVHLLVQSANGIPESTLEFQIGEWLAQHRIDADLHKHFVQLHRPPSTRELVLGAAL